MLIAAGVRAGERKLDLAAVVAVGWLGAVGGAIAGWLLGVVFGRRALAAPGPLFRLRQHMLKSGDQIFERHPVLAILWAPSPMAGMHKVETAKFLAVTLSGTALWAASIAVGAYFAGPTIVHAVDAVGAIAVVGLIVLLAGSIAGETIRRRPRRLRRKRGPAGERER